jgi:hypothetical protein
VLAAVDKDVKVPKGVQDCSDEKSDTSGRSSVLIVAIITDVLCNENDLMMSASAYHAQKTYDRH